MIKTNIKKNKKKRVLILEDDEMVRLIVKDYLIVYGFEILESANPLTAIDILKKEMCHVAIVDINIPQMPGEAFIEKAKKISPHTKFVIHTGKNDYKVSSEMKALGVAQENVLEKPVEDMKTFVSTINRLLQE